MYTPAARAGRRRRARPTATAAIASACVSMFCASVGADRRGGRRRRPRNDRAARRAADVVDRELHVRAVGRDRTRSRCIGRVAAPERIWKILIEQRRRRALRRSAMTNVPGLVTVTSSAAACRSTARARTCQRTTCWPRAVRRARTIVSLTPANCRISAPVRRVDHRELVLPRTRRQRDRRAAPDELRLPREQDDGLCCASG